MQHYYDKSRGPELVVLINMDRGTTEFQLPAGRSWQRLIDTQAWFDGDEYLASKPDLDKRASHNASVDAPVPVAGATYGVSGSSIVVLEAK
jgi:hypothetical protein